MSLYSSLTTTSRVTTCVRACARPTGGQLTALSPFCPDVTKKENSRPPPPTPQSPSQSTSISLFIRLRNIFGRGLSFYIYPLQLLSLLSKLHQRDDRTGFHLPIAHPPTLFAVFDSLCFRPLCIPMSVPPKKRGRPVAYGKPVCGPCAFCGYRSGDGRAWRHVTENNVDDLRRFVADKSIDVAVGLCCCDTRSCVMNTCRNDKKRVAYADEIFNRSKLNSVLHCSRWDKFIVTNRHVPLLLPAGRAPESLHKTRAEDVRDLLLTLGVDSDDDGNIFRGAVLFDCCGARSDWVYRVLSKDAGCATVITNDIVCQRPSDFHTDANLVASWEGFPAHGL